MQNLQARSPLADTGDDADAGAATRARLEQAADALMATDAARRLAGDIAGLMRQDPLAGEQARQVFTSLLAGAIMVAVIERLDDHGECPEVDGRTCRRAGAIPGCAMTLFGKVECTRPRFRPTWARAHPSTGRGRARPDRGGMTPAAAGPALRLTADLAARESTGTRARLTGSGPTVGSLAGPTGEAGRRFEADADALMDELMAEEDVHPDGTAVRACPGGIMLVSG